MIRRDFLFLLAVLLVVLIVCIGCEPVPSDPSAPPSQVEGTVHLEGDSVTWNTYYNGGLPTDYATTRSFTPGSRINYSPWIPEESPYDRVSALASQGQVDTLVMTLGLNEIANGGWTKEYELLWYDLLGQKIPSTSCIVVVKPWVLNVGTAYQTRPLTELQDIRSWMDEFASTHPNVVLVDWMPILEANTHFSDKDGVHINEGSGGAEARDAMYREGLSRCA